MEEGVQLCALFIALKNELLEQYPIDIKDFHTMGLIHSRPEKIDLADVPLFDRLIETHVKKTDTLVTGIDQTEKLKADIDQTEFDLFSKKLAVDVE
eukprot:5287807-Karenia_brevis.AAC.1